MADTGSEFQTYGMAHQKERFAKSVRANGWMSSGVAVERSVRASTLGYCWHTKPLSLSFDGLDVMFSLAAFVTWCFLEVRRQFTDKRTRGHQGCGLVNLRRNVLLRNLQ